MKYGYIRVSTREQNTMRQYEQIRQYVDDDRFIFEDKASGKDFKRDNYLLLTGTEKTAPLLRKGDILYICSIDRLGRSYTEIHKEWRKITQEICADIVVLDLPLLNTTADSSLDNRFIADLTLQILAYVAEKERVSIRARQRAGIDVMPIVDGKRISAKTGKAIGRPSIDFPKDWKKVYNEWQNGAITATAAMQMLHLKRTTFYNLVKRYKSMI